MSLGTRTARHFVRAADPRPEWEIPRGRHLRRRSAQGARVNFAAVTPAGWVAMLWKPVLCVALVAGALFWANGRGYDRAEADNAVQTGALTASLGKAMGERDRAIEANRTLAMSVAAFRDALARTKAENDRLADEGLAAVQEAEGE